MQKKDYFKLIFKKRLKKKKTFAQKNKILFK